jgi:putative endonuclease
MASPGAIYYMFIYILRCSDGTYYTGVTNNLDYRLNQHKWGINKDSYTHSRRPVEVVFWEGFQDAKYAIEWEKKIKSWSRKKKEALINGDFELLPDLSKKKFSKD